MMFAQAQDGPPFFLNPLFIILVLGAAVVAAVVIAVLLSRRPSKRK